jgi:hypothetical protein
MGPLTEQELMDTAAAVCGAGRDSRPASSATVTTATVTTSAPGTNYLGLTSGQFDRVIAELERRFYIPLLGEALQCRSRAQLVAVINTQVTSGV